MILVQVDTYVTSLPRKHLSKNDIICILVHLFKVSHEDKKHPHETLGIKLDGKMTIYATKI